LRAQKSLCKRKKAAFTALGLWYYFANKQGEKQYISTNIGTDFAKLV